MKGLMNEPIYVVRDATALIMKNRSFFRNLKLSFELIGHALEMDAIYFMSLKNNQIIHWGTKKQVEWKHPIEDKDFLLHENYLILPLRYHGNNYGYIQFYKDNNLESYIPFLEMYSYAITLALLKRQQEKKMNRFIHQDSLTHLHNRRYFEDSLQRILSTKDSLPLSIIVVDVNGLKLVNDAFGHIQGDLMIQAVAKILKKNGREEDIISRWGGDEFIMLLPQTDEAGASKLVERILKEADQTSVNHIPISLSLACSTTHHYNQSFEWLFKQAEDLMYQQKLFKSPEAKRKMVEAIMESLFKRIPGEEEHAKRVSKWCVAIGRALNFDEFGIQILRMAGYYHDIGKVAIHEKILNKEGPLTKNEMKEVERHSEIGYRILSSLTELAEIADFIAKHHERMDGTGYPYGLAGDDIPFITRILTVAEAYDAMVSTVSYQAPFSEKEAIDELIKHSGTQFDPQIVRIFVSKVLNKPWYSVIYGINHRVLPLGASFNPMHGVFVHDELDPELSVEDIEIVGHVNVEKTGSYHLIYSITNQWGQMERIIRKIHVGHLVDIIGVDYSPIAWDQVQIDGAEFDFKTKKEMLHVNLINGGANPWSSQLIYSGIPFEKGKTYVVSFRAKTSIPRKEVHLSIGKLDTTNEYWHSFLNTSDNKIFVTPYEDTYTVLFTMEEETYLNTDMKFEFGTGEHTQLFISNIHIYEYRLENGDKNNE